ncbi:MAG: rhodanese-like domain-containing protein [Defluviitaleaceae bacterium]|nr:rhodanese-like domain-containing protein [Defluviitaleaceae bacterium]
MRILIINASEEHLTTAARIRRLDETAKIILVHETGDTPATVELRQKYRVDVRSNTRFVSADMGYANVATLEDRLTQHVYNEEFDKIVNTEQYIASHNFNNTGSYDSDIAVHLSTLGQIAMVKVGEAKARGRHIADELYGRVMREQKPIEIHTADTEGLKLAFFGHTEASLNAQQISHMYSILPIEGGFLKLIYDDVGNILGFAVLGQSGDVMSYADVMSVLVKMGGNIQNMVHMELTSNKNPLTILGKIAQNVIEKRLSMAYADELKNMNSADTVLLDVRHQLEYMAYHIGDSINIPLENLRDSIYRLERMKEIITICNDGKESYLAARILMAHGYKVRHLTGGLVYAKPIISQGQTVFASYSIKD